MIEEAIANHKIEEKTKLLRHYTRGLQGMRGSDLQDKGTGSKRK